MAAKNDFEDLLEDIKDVITTNLATKLLAIASDKGDSITLPIVDSNAYFLQTLNDEAANYDPFIVYGIESIEPSSDIYGDTAEKLSIYVVLVLAETNDDNMIKILFRCQRGLKEIFEENFTNLDIGNKIIVRRLEPVPFESLDSSAQYKAIGITLDTTIA